MSLNSLSLLSKKIIVGLNQDSSHSSTAYDNNDVIYINKFKTLNYLI